MLDKDVMKIPNPNIYNDFSLMYLASTINNNAEILEELITKVEVLEISLREETQNMDMTQKIKDNAHLIAMYFECTEAVLADDTESRYAKECAEKVFFERFRELVKGEQK